MQGNGNGGPARRVKVKGRPGIYFRTTPNGRRYEFDYVDSTGRRRWKTIEGGLREAEAAREEVRARLRRGEKVAPSKVSFGEFADAWLAEQVNLRPRTREWYETAIQVHLKPRIGRVRLSAISEEHVLAVIGGMQSAGLAGWTIRGVLTPLGRILNTAVRRGQLASNPIPRLERSERPKVGKREMRVLDRDDIGKLLDAAPELYRTAIAVSIFTGVRQGELLALRWADLDLAAGRLRVSRQLERKTHALVEPKTPQAIREIVLPPFLVRMLREHWLASPFSGETDPIFASATGKPLHYRNLVRRGLEKAVERAKLDGEGRPKIRWHDLRHSAASLWISEGLNVVYVSRMLGHSSPDITLRVYAHHFDRQAHADRASAALEAAFGGLF